MELLYIDKALFNGSNSTSTTPQQLKGKIITGKPQDLSPHVFNDIIIIKQQLKQYDNQFYNKLFKLLEANHSKDLKALRRKYNRYTSTPHASTDIAQYQLELFRLYKSHLDDYINLLNFYKNNYHNSLYHSNKQLLSLAANMEIDDDEAPDHLLDPISFNLFQDPVVTPSGITYEKCHLVKHLRQKGNYDPLSRQPLFENELYPNLIIKEGVEHFKQLRSNTRCEVAK